ncbi:P-loop containing nucleoside triphosphate hydrolase protein [Trametes polyzona]|nr:P-loop containing nucleoside triphosphate hydrolase protein [Trametes polyzona]
MSSTSSWPIQRIREVVFNKFGKRPCLFQIRIAQALYERRNDVVAVAATGAGKTLSFWIPLLMALEDGEDKCAIIVTPLNILGKQNVDILKNAGMSAVAVDGTTATPEVFKDIEKGRYRVVVLNPEIVMQADGPCQKLWDNPRFTNRIAYFVFDEAHCVKEWSSFREQYKYIGSLRFRISKDIPFYLPSATLDDPLLHDVSATLQLRSGRTEHILRSNDRPDVALAVRKMEFAANSFHDLDFLIPEDFGHDDTPPPKFLIFFDSIREAEAAVAHLRSRLPEDLRHKVAYFHSIMTAEYREDEFAALMHGERYGLCVTDSFGMGLDLPDVRLIIQWKIARGLNTLWQRFGRAARGDGYEGFAILIAEKDYFDEEKQRKAERAAALKARRESSKRKRTEAVDHPSPKRSARAPPGSTVPQVAPAPFLAHEPCTTADEHPAEQAQDAWESARDLRGAEGGDALAVDDYLRADGSDEGAATNDITPGAGEGRPVSLRDQSRATAVVDAEEKRKEYSSRGKDETQGEAARTGKNASKTVDLVVEDLINAEARGFGCRRKPITWAYSNDKRVFDHKLCDTSKPEGCARCSPKPSMVCCDLCNPSAFEYIITPRPAITRKMKKSHIKPSPHTPSSRRLREVLFDWRDQRTLEKFGAAILSDFGGNLFLPTTILDRIVLCAQAGKLSTVDALRRESGWRPEWIDQYGESIMGMCNEIYPPNPPQLPPVQTVAVAASLNNSRAQNVAGSAPTMDTTGRKRRTPTCSVCKQTGHNSRNRLCPGRAGAGGNIPMPDENTEPEVLHWEIYGQGVGPEQ